MKKKIFMIADTHNRLVEPEKPEWADLKNSDYSIHLGDGVDVFKPSVNYEYQDFIDPICKHFTYYTIGNHEDMSFSNYNFIMRYRANQLAPDTQKWIREHRSRDKIIQTFKIENVKFRISHYLFIHPINIVGDLRSFNSENYFMEELSNSGKFNIVCWGHTHRRFFQKIGNTFFLNPGNGELGEYAIITIDDKDIKIELKKM